ncbi:hypothetical protein ACP70R_018902 [Stipagrostis hirtigluma subsp. patula]
MRAGQGNKHGRYYLGDSVIDTASTPSLSQIRARTTAAGPSIRPRPTVTGLETQALQAELQEEKRRREELEAQLQAIRSEQAAREAEARAREQDFYAYMRDQFAALGHNLAPLPS